MCGRNASAHPRFGLVLSSLTLSSRISFGILKFFQSRPDADAFTEAVDWEAFGLNDYPEV